MSGYFFVGAAIVHASGQFPAPLDQSGCISDPVVWYVGSTTGTADFNTLSNNNVPPGQLSAAGIPGVWLLRASCSTEPGSSYCAGDGIDPNITTPCGANGTGGPCNNTGGPGRGCANSVNPQGAKLSADGVVASDNVALHGSGMPATVSCIYLKGDM